MKDLSIVKNFVEEYNRIVDWDNSLIEKLDISDAIYEPIKECIEYNFFTRKISEITHDLDTAEIYEYKTSDGRTGFEMQVFSHEIVHLEYIRIVPTNESEHIAEQIRLLNKIVADNKSKLTKRLDHIITSLENINRLEESLKQYKENG